MFYKFTKLLPALPLFFTHTVFAQNCVSSSGGYCVNLAATAYAQRIPGLEFLKATTDFGELISNIYIFGMGLVGISALLVLVGAGVWYMSAGDNAGRAGEAKKWMGNAIFGLVLALLSWLILYTINPELIRKATLTLDQVDTSPKTATEAFSSCDPLSGLNILCSGQTCPNPIPTGYSCTQRSEGCACVRTPTGTPIAPKPIAFGSLLGSPTDIKTCRSIGGREASCRGGAMCIPLSGNLTDFCRLGDAPVE